MKKYWQILKEILKNADKYFHKNNCEKNLYNNRLAENISIYTNKSTGISLRILFLTQIRNFNSILMSDSSFFFFFFYSFKKQNELSLVKIELKLRIWVKTKCVKICPWIY